MKQGLLPREYSRFDIVDGYYWWLTDHHAGQGSRDYSRLSRLSQVFTPSRLANKPSEYAGQVVYDTLCERHGCTHPSIGIAEGY
jgi:hypothetical protein